MAIKFWEHFLSKLFLIRDGKKVAIGKPVNAMISSRITNNFVKNRREGNLIVALVFAIRGIVLNLVVSSFFVISWLSLCSWRLDFGLLTLQRCVVGVIGHDVFGIGLQENEGLLDALVG